MLAAQDMQALFNATPAALLVLAADPGFTILAATDAYLNATLTRRDEILGRPLFDVFPDNPGDPLANGTSELGASFARVIAERVPHTMPIQRHDIPCRRSVAMEFEERYWAPHNVPLLEGGAQVAQIIHRVEDVTAHVRAADAQYDEQSSWNGRLRLQSRSDLAALREALRDACASAGLIDMATADLLVAATELGANMVVHAGGGVVEIERLVRDGRRGVRLKFRDRGPGIRDFERALAGGHSSTGTLGRGLSGSRVLVDEFVINSKRRGTMVTIAKWQPARRPRPIV